MAETLASPVLESAVPGPSAALLREVDWRFLLPRPDGGAFRHLVLLGASAELAHAIVGLGLAERVSRELPAARTADAVIRLHGAREDVLAAASRLLPGGVLYAEVARRSALAPATAPARMRAQLERSGLAHVRLYWCAPDFARREAYVPLSPAAVARWYLSTLYRGRTLAQELTGAALRTLTRIAAGAPSGVVRHYVVTAVMPPGGAASCSVFDHPELPRALRRDDLNVVVLTRRSRRVVLLPFAPGGSEPLAVLKVSRSADRNAITRHEQSVLADVRALLDDETRSSIPEPRGCPSWGELTVGIESYLGGRRLSISNGARVTSARRQVADLNAVMSWITDFHRQVQTRDVRWRDSSGPDTLASTAADYAALFGTAHGEQTLFAHTLARSAELLDARIPMVWSHGDLGAGNINRTRDGIAVLDWASARADLPLLDLLYCVTRWIRTSRRAYGEADTMQVCRELFLEERPAGGLVRAARDGIAHYVRELDIDPRFVPLLSVLLWSGHAVHKFRRAQEPEQDAANSYSARLFASHVRALAGDPDALYAPRFQHALRPGGRR